MIEKVNAPVINGKLPWHKPGVLEWLNKLGKASGLCEVNQQKMKRNTPLEVPSFT